MKLTPYSFTDENGEPSGYLHDVMIAVLKEAGLSQKIKLLPLKRLLQGFKSGRHDCTLIANSPTAQSVFRIIEPIGKKLQIGVLPAFGRVIENYEDLKDLKIGIPLGVSFDKGFDADKNLDKIQTNDYVENVKMLNHGRLTAIAGSIDSFYLDARKLGLDPDTLFGEPYVFISLDLVLACAKESPSKDVISKLKQSVQNLRENGQIQKIIDKYL